jgi:hypothetical protein
LATDEILDWLDNLSKIEEHRGASNQAV